VVKASELVAALGASRFEGPTSNEFPLQPRVSVTAIHGGEGYTVTPDRCVVSVDARTTPAFDSEAALQLISGGAAEVDRRWPGTSSTAVRLVHDWPPYALIEASDLRAALLRSAEALGMQVTPKISGPSNIGNYLATLGVPATAGFGVRYRGLHAVDERIEVASIPTVHATYHSAVLDLLAPDR
jgi:succinyl-diaminopimelate desuccinylase